MHRPTLTVCLCCVCALALSALAPRTFISSAQVPEANYDENKVGAYTLPDPLTLQSGEKVSSAAVWKKQRRAEILRLFETHVYGRGPAGPGKISYRETARDEQALGGIAVRREIDIRLTAAPDAPLMHLLLYTPKKRTRPAPVFVGLNFNGNHAVSPEPGVTISTAWMNNKKDGTVVDNRSTEKSRGLETGRWPLEMIVRRGYAIATIHCNNLFPDHQDGYAGSILPHLYGARTIGPEDGLAMSAWAWGLSRALDYFEKDRDLDAKRVAVWGHSRLGKAALWAGATDQRFAMVISNDSGEGGAALARRNFGESLLRITTAFPHWFCGNYKKYGHDIAALPVDQHMLLSLIAPRPLYVASAAEDLWADPRGEFLSAQAASAVYRLFGKTGLENLPMPGIHQPVQNTVGYHIRAGKHDVTDYDWEQYLNFADKFL
ncbi:MAG: alpha/beta hydrolase family protein [Blastocatellia bacterium]